MNTEFFVLKEKLNEDINESMIPEISVDERNILFFFIEITRYLQEIESLFRVYRCNLNIMNNICTLYCDDTIDYKIDCKEDKFIVINTLVINLISSGKVLMESIDNFTKMLEKSITDYSNDFKKEHLSKTYDENFTYRFLLLLRNYSQHGHLPVSNLSDNRFCFDLNKIINTPHMNIKKTMERELIKWIEEIYVKFNDNPYILLTKTIADYNLLIHELYTKFLNSIEQLFDDILSEIDELLRQKPELIYSSNDDFNGMILIKDVHGAIHCFKYSKSKVKKMITDFKEEAQNYLNKENKENNLLNKSIILK